MPPSPGSGDLSAEAVQQRFAAARRSGTPAWLWPEITIDAWQRALERIHQIVAAVLAGEEPVPLGGDPAAVGLACYTSGTGPLLGWWLDQGLVTADSAVADLLSLHLRHNIVRAARMELSAVAVVKAMLARGISVVVLKGAHTGSLYFPHPGARPASDIDLLVRPGDRVAAEAVLEAAGFSLASRGPMESSWRAAGVGGLPKSLEFVHADDPWTIDLHHSLDVMAAPGAVAALDRADPMARNRPWSPCSDAAVLDQPLLLLHLAVHAGVGLQSLTMLRLVELVLVIRQDGSAGRLFWDAFLATAARADALGFAYPALALCETLSAGTVPAWVLERCAASAPARARAVIGRLTPATAQRVHRTSVAEHFMWADGWRGALRQLGADLAPTRASWRHLWSIYETRAWRLVRRRFSR